MITPITLYRTATVLLAFCLLVVSVPAMAQLEWPQEIAAPEGTIVVYQPQPEKLAGNVLSGRAAISLEFNDREDPVFGAMWFTARIDTDSDADVALVRDLKVEKVAWPDSKDAAEQRFTAIVEGAIPAARRTQGPDPLQRATAGPAAEPPAAGPAGRLLPACRHRLRVRHCSPSGWRPTGHPGYRSLAWDVDFSPNSDQHYLLESGNSWFILPIRGELSSES
jgi:hypothetical protein